MKETAAKQPPLFNWLDHRAAGVLMHPTSLPGPFGIGTLGVEAHRFVSQLEKAGFKYWQILPSGPTGFGDSPYQAFSAFAGNPYWIDLRPLMEAGLLSFDELGPLENLPEDHVAFGELYKAKWPILRLAFRRFKERQLSYVADYGLFEDFKQQEATWLDPFALYMSLKEHANGRPWYEWDASLRTYDDARQSSKAEELAPQCEAQRFFQYLFFGQWNLLRRKTADAGISIVGDIPIFVALDSADTWAHPEIFQFKEAGKPEAVAGVPPDYFSPKGQLWGNPLFDWDQMAKDGYSWWMERLRMNFRLFDVVRIDHFRGFEAYWSIPASEGDARKGQWVNGPGLDFFKRVHEEFPDAKLIAEDLGDISEDVRVLRRATGLPGMAILEFGFDLHRDNLYLPCNLERMSVLYPGTHDNNTVRGWYEDDTTEAVQDQVRRFLRVSGHDISWDFIRSAYRSVSRLAIIAMQDFLSLGSEARFNRPGDAQGNWQWRCTHAQMEEFNASANYLQELTWLYNR